MFIISIKNIYIFTLFKILFWFLFFRIEFDGIINMRIDMANEFKIFLLRNIYFELFQIYEFQHNNVYKILVWRNLN